MGKSDIKVKQFLRNKKRFADLFNGTVFAGEQIVKPEELEEIDSEVSIVIRDKSNLQKSVQKYRDITMVWKKGIKLCVLACENQNKIHYAMPVRMMLYDGLTYTNVDPHIDKDNGSKAFPQAAGLYPGRNSALPRCCRQPQDPEKGGRSP